MDSFHFGSQLQQRRQQQDQESVHVSLGHASGAWSGEGNLGLETQDGMNAQIIRLNRAGATIFRPGTKALYQGRALALPFATQKFPGF
ncbi:MAG TPA: hypothetical protein VND90_03425 [Terracidiphilus sp.]|nr:hypothetical protein [Terracidiphilus sp.]